MGCDGGSIPKRIEVVQTKQKQEKLDLSGQHLARWFFCTLSRLPLRAPIVGCRLGRMYNKDALYEYLLDPTSHGDGDKVCAHIRKPKDVVTLNLAEQSARTDAEIRLFQCPITMKEMNGHQRFIFFWTCGCVMSEQALKEMPSDGTCLVCGKAYDKEQDVYPLNPKPEEAAILQERLLLQSKTKKKHRKDKEEKTQTSLKRKAEANLVPEGAKKSGSHSQPSESALQAVPKIIQAKNTSAAIQSLYKSSKPTDDMSSKESWLTKGTFTRYVA